MGFFRPAGLGGDRYRTDSTYYRGAVITSTAPCGLTSTNPSVLTSTMSRGLTSTHYTGVMWINVDNRFLLPCGLTSTVFDVIRNKPKLKIYRL
jgi:hypothetical protein